MLAMKSRNCSVFAALAGWGNPHAGTVPSRAMCSMLLRMNADTVSPSRFSARAAFAADPDRVWVIGGASVYEQMLPHTDRVVVTHNRCVRPADTFFPDLASDPAWHVESTEPGGTTPEGVEFEFRTYVRA